MRRVLVLGSTGSVGTQALDVIAGHPDELAVAGLVAGGSRPELLAAQTARFPGAKVATGIDGALRLIDEVDADVVLNAIDGSIGLAPTLAALATGRPLALANKESLIAGGPLVLAAAGPGQLVSVDSEHSALAQCLRAGRAEEVAQLVLTASGGPFRGRRPDELVDVTLDQAMAHPTWNMGPVITVNSATLVNKGLELIEAHLLFGVPYERIETVVHPQSVVHSMVTFRDGATIAQASPPDMGLPIALGLTWPDRLPDVAAACDFSSPTSWTFEPVDHEAFPALRLARRAGQAGGLVPATYNAANEVAVAAFRGGLLTFPGISAVLAGIIDEAEQAETLTRDPEGVDDVLAAENWARGRARELATERAGATR
ncbi:1-deoxy-D-xylulose-5-phosphate reductoisomerase [Nakamurella lactea]|uniref:1-deoxy-D-xylulose-5-phosphate reductoisomerase n=1 Tax=Nakamurella lactea TaxID=459515 RepID=UPI00041B67EA|nr:1-deoxy-D-xylulose-5-phosphate reductoisomerase [Nakamurella lactea]